MVSPDADADSNGNCPSPAQPWCRVGAVFSARTPRDGRTQCAREGTARAGRHSARGKERRSQAAADYACAHRMAPHRPFAPGSIPRPRPARSVAADRRGQGPQGPAAGPRYGPCAHGQSAAQGSYARGGRGRRTARPAARPNAGPRPVADPSAATAAPTEGRGALGRPTRREPRACSTMPPAGLPGRCGRTRAAHAPPTPAPQSRDRNMGQGRSRTRGARRACRGAVPHPSCEPGKRSSSSASRRQPSPPSSAARRSTSLP